MTKRPFLGSVSRPFCFIFGHAELWKENFRPRHISNIDHGMTCHYTKNTENIYTQILRFFTRYKHAKYYNREGCFKILIWISWWTIYQTRMYKRYKPRCHICRLQTLTCYISLFLKILYQSRHPWQHNISYCPEEFVRHLCFLPVTGKRNASVIINKVVCFFICCSIHMQSFRYWTISPYRMESIKISLIWNSRWI